MTLAYWICAVVTAASSFTSCGFSTVALLSSDGKAKINAMYAFTRSIALALASIVVFFNQARSWLEALALIMIVVQLGDTIIGIKIHDSLKTYGPAITALVNFAALIWLIH
jgi:hypothetical protein